QSAPAIPLKHSVVHDRTGARIDSHLRHRSGIAVVYQRVQDAGVFWRKPNAPRACSRAQLVRRFVRGAMNSKTSLNAVILPLEEHGIWHRFVPLRRAVIDVKSTGIQLIISGWRSGRQLLAGRT